MLTAVPSAVFPKSACVTLVSALLMPTIKTIAAHAVRERITDSRIETLTRVCKQEARYFSEYVIPVVNWNEFFLNVGGGSFKNVSVVFTARLNRLYTGMVMPASPAAE